MRFSLYSNLNHCRIKMLILCNFLFDLYLKINTSLTRCNSFDHLIFNQRKNSKGSWMNKKVLYDAGSVEVIQLNDNSFIFCKKLTINFDFLNQNLISILLETFQIRRNSCWVWKKSSQLFCCSHDHSFDWLRWSMSPFDSSLANEINWNKAAFVFEKQVNTRFNFGWI